LVMKKNNVYTILNSKFYAKTLECESGIGKKYVT